MNAMRMIEMGLRQQAMASEVACSWNEVHPWQFIEDKPEIAIWKVIYLSDDGETSRVLKLISLKEG